MRTANRPGGFVSMGTALGAAFLYLLCCGLVPVRGGETPAGGSGPVAAAEDPAADFVDADAADAADGDDANIPPTLLPPTAVDGGYDVLPMRYKDMSKYDQIALEPYRDRYDNMTVGEKAKVYAQAFQFMRNRQPRFDPKVTMEFTRFKTASKSKNAIVSKQYMYKPPVPKKKIKKKPEVTEQPADALLGSLPGPWEHAPPPPPEPEPEEVEEEEPATPMPSYQDYADDNRMENLRQGWNAKDVLRGRRNR